MRNSNSRDKPSTTTYTQNRLMKTQLPPKSNTKQALNSTQYKLPPTTPSIKRIQSSKSTNVSTKQIPKQDVNFDIENNMTESKIISAKQSLQLLKKKMNRTGMSRQKMPASGQSNNNIQTLQKTTYAPQSMKKIKSDSTKNIENYEPTYNKYEQQQSYNKKQTYEPASYKAPSKKVIPQQQKASVKKQIPQKNQSYYNQAQQIPIARKQTFEEMLERQLKKQQAAKKMASNNNNSSNAKNQMPSEYSDQQGELYECRKGCGRQFNENVLAKHEKICEKVFQSKRKAFNTAAQRQIQAQAYSKQQSMNSNTMNQTKKQPEKKSNIPKWKLQSAQLRAGLQTTTSKPLTAQQQALNNMQKDLLVPCNFCGRKFNQTAANRHIPVCQQKHKQMRPSNPKKR